MTKRCLLLLVGLSALSLPLPAQSNVTLDRILAEEELRYGSALYLLVSASSEVYPPGVFDIAGAVRRVHQRVAVGDDKPITLGQYAFMLKEFFELPQGVLYRLFPGPRYATRDLAHAELIRGRAYPNMPVSGRRAIRILGQVLHYRDGTL